MLLCQLSITEEVLGGKVKQLCQTLSTASFLACVQTAHIYMAVACMQPCYASMQHDLVHTYKHHINKLPNQA